MQSLALGIGLIGADHTKSFALTETRIIETAPVLDAQYGFLRHHSPNRTLTMRLENVFHRNRCFIRMVDHPVVSLYGWPVPFGHGSEGAIRCFCLCAGTTNKPVAQAFVTQRCIAKFFFCPCIFTEASGNI